MAGVDLTDTASQDSQFQEKDVEKHAGNIPDLSHLALSVSHIHSFVLDDYTLPLAEFDDPNIDKNAIILGR